MKYDKMTSLVGDNFDMYENLLVLGLDENEAHVYSAFLLKDSQTISEASRQLNIPRSTIYKTCDRLVNKGFAKWIVGTTANRIEIIKPQELSLLVKEKERQLKSMQSAIVDLTEMVKITQKSTGTKVRYYEGRSGMRQMIWNSLKAENGIVGYSEFGRIAVVGKDFYDNYNKEFKLRKLVDNVITNEAGLKYINEYVLIARSVSQLKKDNVRIIPKSRFYVSGDTSIYNNVYANCYWTKGEIVGVEIENSELAMLHKSIFKILWAQAIPLMKFLALRH